MSEGCRAPQYRKKPIVIEALQFDGSVNRAVEICTWANSQRKPGEDPWCDYVTLDGLEGALEFKVHTLEGDMLVSPGDFVICGVKGEFYPCKPDIFAATYDTLATQA